MSLVTGHKNKNKTMSILLLSLAVLPVFILGFYIYQKDKFEKEPVKMLLRAFFFGCLSVIPALFIEEALTTLYATMGGEKLSGVASGIYNGYVVAGGSEELCKLVCLYLAVWKRSDFNEYFDGIVYAAFVSLGFAGIENVLYVFGSGGFAAALMTGTLRAVLSVPGHFLFAMAMGYYFALAKFQPEHRMGNLVKAFIAPMLLHGTFDALLMVPEAMGSEYSWLSAILFPLFIWFDIRLWKIGMRKLKKLQQLSEQQMYYGNYDF